MNLYKIISKLTAQILFVTIIFSTLHAKNQEKFDNGKYISDYFSGILLLNDNRYNESYKFLKQLDGLEKNHLNYSKKYIRALINSEKFLEAFNYSKKIEKSNQGIFESDLIIGIFYLKNKKYDLAEKYFSKIKEKKSGLILDNFVSSSLLSWSKFDKIDLDKAKIIINSIDSRFENLKKIQSAFMHCYYNSQNVDLYFKELSSDKKVDFSRYNYFYASYLLNLSKANEAKKIINESLKKYPRNLLLNQLNIDLISNKLKVENNFNCQNPSHVAAEILYITANALSSQSIFTLSNFYLNLAKYLNKDFHSFNNLLAENFYKINEYSKAKKIYSEINKKGSIFSWHSAKQKSKILIMEKNKNKAITNLKNAYNKLQYKSIYQKFDYAEFLKSNEQYEESIKFYTEIIEEISQDHNLFAEVMDGRGVAYERTGKWKKAEKDLLRSLEADPNQAYVINYLAYSWIEKGIKIDKSLKMLKKANNLKSNDPFIIDSLGWAMFKLKRYTESKEYLQTAVQLMPDDPIVNDHFGDALWKNGQKIQARYYWNYVLNLNETEKDLKKSIENKLLSGL